MQEFNGTHCPNCVAGFWKIEKIRRGEREGSERHVSKGSPV